MNENVTSGFHPYAKKQVERHFSTIEATIADKWADEWYVSSAGVINIGEKSIYKYLLIKATADYEKIIGINREIVVVFSSYQQFEPRTLDAYESICKNHQANRIERICYVLISADVDIETHLLDCLSSQESQVIIPFSYEDFKKVDVNFFKKVFNKNFYTRDLYDISTPLKK